MQGFREFLEDKRKHYKGVNSIVMIEWLKLEHAAWLINYVGRHSNMETAFMLLRGLLRDAAKSLGYKWRRARPAPKLTPQQLEAAKTKFAGEFWAEHADVGDSDIFNIDETGVFFDMPPTYTFAQVGGSTHVDGDEKKSARITAVLAARRDGTCDLYSSILGTCPRINLNKGFLINLIVSGTKLPVMFIVKATPGGTIDDNELATYPAGHYYQVQRNAWMDGRIWADYLSRALEYSVIPPPRPTFSLECISCIGPRLKTRRLL
jgi:hypothetical protein